MEKPRHPSEALTILVVDDMEASREELMALVQNLGHHPLAASSGEEALRQIDEHAPDVALLDLVMPTMSGYELARSIRKRVVGRWLPVIIMSSLEGVDYLDKALAMGAADYMIKPLMPSILRAKLRQYQRFLSMQRSLGTLAQRHKAIHDHIADAVITTDATGKIYESNQSARTLFSLDDGILNQGIFVQDATGYALQSLLGHLQVEIRTSGGKVIPFGVSCNNWEHGDQEFFTIVLHDLSEARRLERMKDEFLATVSHELRTPLTSIVGALKLMASGAGGSLPAPAHKLADVAVRNGERLSKLIDDMLDLTKLEGNRMPIHLQSCELMPFLRDSVQVIQAYALKGDVTVALEDNQPAIRVSVDGDRLMQVMANLLSNAIKHSPKGSQVVVRVHRQVQQVHVHVQDQGPGISAEFKTKLFEKFSQADSSDRRAVGGTGLGLYISRMLIEKMGGSISAHAAPGGGSIFRITLPRLLLQSERPWLMCLAKDRDLQDKMTHWLHHLGSVECVSSIEEAISTIDRLGPPATLIASPHAQGPSDMFCAQLITLAKARHIALFGDSLHAGLASRYGMTWLDQGAPSHSTTEKVRNMVNDTKENP